MIYFILIAVVNLVGMALLLRLSNMKCYHELRGSAINPLVFFSFLSLFFNIDFYFLWKSGGVLALQYETPISLTEKDVLYGYMIYTLLFMSACAGILVAQRRWMKGRKWQPRLDRPRNSSAKRFSSNTILLVSLVIGIYAYYEIGKLSGSEFGNIARQSVFRENRWLIISFLFIPPALVIFLANNFSRKYIASFAVIVSLIILYSTGTRGHIIYVGLIVITMLQLNGYQVRKMWFLLGVPFVALFLLFERFNRRYQGDAGNFAEFIVESNGAFSLFFYTGEISMAEVISTIVKKAGNFDRYPFESFVGFIMYPFPRSIFTFKPYGSGAAFTDYVAPIRRAVSGSELATTGYGDLIMQFGIISSVLVMFIVAYFWNKGCLAVVARGVYFSMIWIPILVWSMYIFIRSGMFDVGGKLWFFVVTYFVYLVMAKFLREISRTKYSFS